MEKIWLERSFDEKTAFNLKKSLDLPFLLAKALAARGIEHEEEAINYLSPSFNQLIDPFLFSDVKKAAECLVKAVLNKETIGVFGDYDVDGVCSATILSQFLLSLGANVKVSLPNRLRDGYGLNKEAVHSLALAGAQKIITVDCGITAYDPIAYANSLGLSVIVIDHHEVGLSLPPAFAVINPKRQDCQSGASYLCAAGLTFFFCLAVRKLLRDQGYFNAKEPDLREMLDLVSLATICDVVPLVKNNRVLVKSGLSILKQGKRLGLKALIDTCDLKQNKITATTLGFHLGPKINAAGRLQDPNIALSLLSAADNNQAQSLAHELHETNNARKELEILTFNQAVSLIENHGLNNNRSLVLYDDKWHPGVVGIVAGRIAEKYYRPSIIIGQGGKGSGRSIRGVDLHRAVNQASKSLVGFGGHAHAIGLTLGPWGVNPFQEALAREMEQFEPELFIPKIFYDSSISIKDINLSVIDDMEKLAPFGAHNPSIVFRINNCAMHYVKSLEGGHIKGELRDHDGRISFIGFRMDAPKLHSGLAMDILGVAEINEWQGFKNPQIRLIDYRVAPGSSRGVT
jgi:single-stranded-DNA-specific exonuclease